MKTESSTNSPTATLAPTKSQRDPVGLQATSPPSHLTGDLRTLQNTDLFTGSPVRSTPDPAEACAPASCSRVVSRAISLVNEASFCSVLLSILQGEIS